MRNKCKKSKKVVSQIAKKILKKCKVGSKTCKKSAAVKSKPKSKKYVIDLNVNVKITK